VVESLLQDKRVDPSAIDNYAFRLACANGHLAVVERLLQDERVDPSASNNDAICVAAEFGHIAVAERLLQDARVDVSVDDFEPMLWRAARAGRVAMFKLSEAVSR
jgi:hypothetical protein